MTESVATDWSVAFLGQLIAQGLTHCVVSPGARSQALALAALEWQRTPGCDLTVHVVVDERSAAFFALGLAVETKKPAVCISTSGSAPAHYFPAVLEALHQGVPLMCLTADRPEALRGVGANQTTNQQALFGPRVPSWSVEATSESKLEGAPRIAHEAWQAAVSGSPVQVNVAFSEPLSAPLNKGSLQIPEALPEDPDQREPVVISLAPEPGTLVIAGHGASARAEKLAHDLGAPLIAEVASGARFGPHLVLSYQDVLSEASLPGEIKRVITCGRPTLSRAVTALLERGDLDHIAVRGSALEPSNLSRSAHVVDEIHVDVTATKEQSAHWVKPWVMASRDKHNARVAEFLPNPPDLEALQSDDQAVRSGFAKAEMEVLRRPITRESLALEVWDSSWPHDRLVWGASRMIRVADQIVGGKNITVHANRGLSGIDGTIATARGIAVGALDSGMGGTTRVVLGDLATLHDVGSLLVDPAAQTTPRVHVIVANDGGGTIFDELEVRATASSEDFDRVLYTPHEVDLGSLARAYGWAYRQVSTMGDLTEALGLPDSLLVIDVTLAR